MVHHEVQEFNLTVALRRSVLQEFLIIPVYLPLAIVGFTPGAFFLIFAAHNLYQFLIHTPYFPEMRPLGIFLNTPHHHTVHHGRNDRYIDKNFAGIFIFWDKLFGTFEPLTETPEYGIDQPTTTLNPVKAQFTTLSRVIKQAVKQPTLAKKISVFWAPPGSIGADEQTPVEENKPRKRFDPPMSRSSVGLAVTCFVIGVVGVTMYRNAEAFLSLPQRYLVLLSLGVLLYVVGSLLDGRLLALPLRTKTKTHQASQ